MITVKKSKKRFFYVLPGSYHISNHEILQEIREGEVEFLDCNQEREMIAMIGCKELNKGKFGVIEKTTQGDTALLSRIIRNGGLIEYTKKLERIKK